VNKTAIEWTDFTWNPISGCTERCAYCYAHRLAEGRLRNLYLANANVAPGCDPDDPFSPRFWPDRLDGPFGVKRPSKIFVCSMGELFDPNVPRSWIEGVLATVGEADWHTFQFLTKQPQRAAEFTFPPNVWAGVTIEDGGLVRQLRLRRLGDVDAPVRFLSFEPLTGPTTVLPEWVDWVIIGAMTGPGATQPEPEWVQDLIDAADTRGIPFFLKDNLHWPRPRQQWPGEEPG
jgi:protein gp37